MSDNELPHRTPYFFMRTLQTLFIAVSATLFGIAVISHISAQKLSEWEATTGRLEYAYTQNLSSPTTAAASDWGKDKPVVKYKFTYQGKTHIGNKVMMLDFVYTPKERVTSLKKGNIKIFFNPQNPEESMLYIDYPKTSIFMLLTAAVLLIIASFLLPTVVRYITDNLLTAKY